MSAEHQRFIPAEPDDPPPETRNQKLDTATGPDHGTSFIQDFEDGITPAAALGRGGPLSRGFDGFVVRSQQQDMAEAVSRALEQSATLIIEAGTGTGKTFAYLVPAVLSGLRVIVSTGTKNLQDQLFYRDLPVVRRALGVTSRAALLKGRSNYLCLYRMERLMTGDAVTMSRRQADVLHQVQAWLGRTRAGDLDELTAMGEDAPLRHLITSTADNCLGQSCPRFSDCYIVKARRAAQEADLVVVNHHLLFADMALKEDGLGDVLPGADAFIVDEAHQVPDVATQFFGASLGSRQLMELAHDTRVEGVREAADMAGLREAADVLETRCRDLVLAFAGPPRRMTWDEAVRPTAVSDGLIYLRAALEELQTHLNAAAPRGKGLENCRRRGGELAARLTELCEPVIPEAVHWVEVNKGSFRLCLTPLGIADKFASRLEQQPAAWIFTSATLAVEEDFHYFADRLGLGHAETRRWESPFDFQRNALLYLPEAMPLPDAPEYTRAVVETAVPVIEASRGRAFLLFTSHRALQQAAALLRDTIEYPLLIQGTAPRGILLDRFRAAGDAVLLGTHSFWEGVDVRGPALSCVIIDKLPFASPDDPVLRARIQLLRERGENAFADYQLPNAVIALKQGFGRLIRGDEDKGLVMLCDPRLLSKPYGKVFLNSLPAMPRTRSLAEACDYLKSVP
jgi:ATP-dependent DNA helicase DinG